MSDSNDPSAAASRSGTRPLSPREFLRARRPGQFSDSSIQEGPILDRALLEYHLGTITNRLQETDFANYARLLAQQEICPNLLPQTGPTGGGDSKVDSETYPVADSLAHVWHVGLGRDAASERWAFAFSAKQKWRPKLKSDIEKLTSTGRGYAKAFFVTSQYVRDKERAEVEDQLRDAHKLDVRVLDRSWILDRTFAGHHEVLAIETLRISVSRQSDSRKGPRDAQRETELQVLEGRIRQAIAEGHPRFQIVEDCIESALLARGLERSRAEVEGLLERAERNALEWGTPHQRLLSSYNHAWTAFWWFEDHKLLAEKYADVELLAQGTGNAYELELLTNLWFLLQSAVSKGWLAAAEAKLEPRRASLGAELTRLAAEVDRPSTALRARTLALQVRLVAGAEHDQEAVLRELEDVIHRSEGLVGFPFEPLAKLLLELGSVLEDSKAFQSLFETLTAATARRDGEISGARMWLERGAQQLRNLRPYEAIRSLGRSLAGLHKDETRDEIVRALYLCGCSYEQAGLLWAARGTLLRAASVATDDLWTYAEVTMLQAACYSRLKWLELELGRVPHALAWHALDLALRGVLRARGQRDEDLESGDSAFDSCLGLLLLRTDIWQVSRLRGLPDSLDRLGLCNSAVALWYALGYDERVPKDLLTNGNTAAALEFFRRWRDEPAGADLPSAAEWYDGRTVTLSTIVLGCHMVLETPSRRYCIEIAEAVLGALEGFMATALVDGGIAREPVLTIAVRPVEFSDEVVAFELRELAGVPHVEIKCSDRYRAGMRADEQAAVQRKLVDLIATVCGRAFVLTDTGESLRRLIVDEQGMTRAVSFAASPFALDNVLGPEPRLSLDDWITTPEYPLKRSEEWDASDRRAAREQPAPPTPVEPLRPGTGPPPDGLFEIDRLKHSGIKVVSVIREPLWNRARWSGLLFEVEPTGRLPSVMAPVFREKEAASAIFEQWRREFGVNDEGGHLRLAIIRGISRANPFWYRLVVGPNMARAFHDAGQTHVVAVCRVHTMTPDSDVNLSGFLQSYRKVGAFIFAHAVCEPGAPLPSSIRQNYLVKRDLTVREAWEIGRNDPDALGIAAEDDPIVPEGQSAPPVAELLRWKRESYQQLNEGRTRSPQHPRPGHRRGRKPGRRRR